MIRNKTLIALAALAAVLLAYNLPYAADYSTNISDMAIIFNTRANEAPRGLMKFNLPVEFSGKTVKSARLLLSISFDLSDSALADLTVWPIAIPWSSHNVNWQNPWNQPGGDFADSSYALYATDDGSSRIIEVDISGIASAWAQGWYANNGLMLIMLRADRFSFDLLPNNEWQGSSARVEITYED